MITVDRARELFIYNPETGELRWKASVKNGNGGRACKVKAGDLAGHKDRRGYYSITVDYKPYRAHRLAWMIFYGEQPPAVIDHANGEFADNRIANLRAATVSENQRNKRLQRNSTSKLKGVSFHKSRGVWVAHITLNSTQKHLGCFRCPTAAHFAYCRAAKAYFGEFARPE